MDVGSCIGTASNRRAHRIDYTKDKSTFASRQLYSSKRISRFARLRNSYYHISLLYNRIAISELRSIGNLNRYAAKTFYQIFTYQSSMPRRTAGYNDETTSIHQLITIVNNGRKTYIGSLSIDTATHAIKNTLRLLKNLLKHEMRITTFLYHAKVYIHSAHLMVNFLVAYGDNVYTFITIDNSNIAIFKIYHLIGIFHNRRSIRCQEIFSFAQANDKRTCLTSCNNYIGIILVEHRNSIRAYHLLEGTLYSLQQLAVMFHFIVLYQLNQYLGIGIADKLETIL